MIENNSTPVSKKFCRNSKINPFEKCVYMYLKSFGESHKTYSEIMDATGLNSRTTISKILKSLEKKGLIKRVITKGIRANLFTFPKFLKY